MKKKTLLDIISEVARLSKFPRWFLRIYVSKDIDHMLFETTLDTLFKSDINVSIDLIEYEIIDTNEDGAPAMVIIGADL